MPLYYDKEHYVPNDVENVHINLNLLLYTEVYNDWGQLKFKSVFTKSR